ncbi:MAG: sigma-54-dependent Fis family transcriptional regulator [Acidobacteria bacterium]|nr:sigma-54-dependent Fis family transcriptional regulator [Acidobacteriota bacterium]
MLIADDQPDVLEALRLLLKGEGFRIDTVTSPVGIIAALEEGSFDGLLMDLNYTRDTTSGREGLDLLPQLRDLDSTLPVIVMTAWGSVDGAVEAMRHGARDYIEKPWDNARLIATVRTQLELGRALRQSQRLEVENRMLRREGLPEMIAESRAMEPILKLMERVGPSDANLLITGEHGTGKEIIARWLHAGSNRADRPLVTVNVGGLAEGTFESELFGHVKGAFTDAKTDRVGYFELADHGTLFLDEIANVPMPQQPSLLRVIESGEMQRVGSSRTRRVDVRIISATNVDVQQEIEKERFREDLLYRLNTVEIPLPPLRDRREDIPLLAAHFLRRHAAHYGRDVFEFESMAMQLLLEHPWPGNVRELEHAVERACLMASGTKVTVEDLGLRERPDGTARLEQMKLEEAERYLIQKALGRVDNNVSQAAEALGLSRSALYRRLQRFGLHVADN